MGGKVGARRAETEDAQVSADIGGGSRWASKVHGIAGINNLCWDATKPALLYPLTVPPPPPPQHHGTCREQVTARMQVSRTPN